MILAMKHYTISTILMPISFVIFSIPFAVFVCYVLVPCENLNKSESILIAKLLEMSKTNRSGEDFVKKIYQHKST